MEKRRNGVTLSYVWFSVPMCGDEGYGDMKIWGFGDMEIWRYGDIGIWGYGDVEIWRYGYVEI